MFRIINGYKLEFCSLRKLIDKTKNGEYVPNLEVTEVVLVQYNLVDSQYQQNSIV